MEIRMFSSVVVRLTRNVYFIFASYSIWTKVGPNLLHKISEQSPSRATIWHIKFDFCKNQQIQIWFILCISNIIKTNYNWSDKMCAKATLTVSFVPYKISFAHKGAPPLWKKSKNGNMIFEWPLTSLLLNIPTVCAATLSLIDWVWNVNFENSKQIIWSISIVARESRNKA